MNSFTPELEVGHGSFFSKKLWVKWVVGRANGSLSSLCDVEEWVNYSRHTLLVKLPIHRNEFTTLCFYRYSGDFNAIFHHRDLILSLLSSQEEEKSDLCLNRFVDALSLLNTIFIKSTLDRVFRFMWFKIWVSTSVSNEKLKFHARTWNLTIETRCRHLSLEKCKPIKYYKNNNNNNVFNFFNSVTLWSPCV